MKDTILKALRLFLTMILLCIICFFLVMSFNVLKVGLFTESIGYDVYGTLKTEDGENKDTEQKSEYLYTYYFEDGDDKRAEEYENKGYELIKYSVRSEVEPVANAVISAISQLFCFIIAVFLIYGKLWKYGNRDFEATRLHGLKFSKLKGLYIGILANLPMLIFLIFAVAAQNKIKLPVSLFALANSYMFEILTAINRGIVYFADANVWRIIIYFATLLFVPAVSAVSYYIGFKDIVISDKLIYKNTKKKKGKG